MRIQLIQRKVDIGSEIKVKSQTEGEVSGVLTDLGVDYIILNRTKGDIILESKTIVSVECLGAPAEPGSSDEVISEELNIEQTDASILADNNLGLEVSIKTDPVLKELINIKKRLNNFDESNVLELKPPDITFPASELTDWRATDVSGKWVSIKNKYDNAKKINELSDQYGRIKPIRSELETIIKRFPESPTLKRVLAYFYSLSGDWGNTLQNYQEAAIQSKQADDWFSLAVSALKLNRKELTCYSLEQYFHEHAIINDHKAWVIYANLMGTFNNTSAFREYCKNDVLVDEENLNILLDTAIYLLNNTVNEASARNIIQKRLEVASSKPLLEQACQLLNGEPVESYRYFLEEFRNVETSLKDKLTKHISSNTAKKPTPRTTSSKKKQTQKKQTQKKQTPKKHPLYTQAKDADENGNLEEAVEIYWKCLTQNVNYESVINDLAGVLLRLKRPEEAVEILEKYREKKRNKVPPAINNQLINCYGHTKEYGKSINLLNFSLSHTRHSEKQFQIRVQIANSYNMLGEHHKAIEQLTHLQKMRPDNITVQHNLAISLSKEGHYVKAKEVLQAIQKTSPDMKTAELLETIEKVEKGNSNPDIEFSTELSRFDLFHLERCEFASVPGIRVWEGKYVGNAVQGKKDIKNAEDYAKSHQTIRPEDRSRYYLAAARIYFDLEDYNEFLYRYLCRCFSSMGDDARDKSLDLDTIRGYYNEALRVYDVIYDDEDRIEEQDAGNALSRFLFSYLGKDNIPRSSPQHTTLEAQKGYIVKAITKVISDHEHVNEVFDAIGFLLNSRYAKNHILPCLYNDSDLSKKALTYLQNNEIDISNPVTSQDDFDRLWNRLIREKVEKEAIILGKFDEIKSNFEFTTISLEVNIQHVKNIRSVLFFKLDHDYIDTLLELLAEALVLCNEISFEAQADRCNELEKRCTVLLTGIEKNPTSLSIEKIRPIIEVIQNRVDEHLKSLYETSRPKLELRLDSDTYTPKDEKINVQIVIENEKGRMAANLLELIIQDNNTLFSITDHEIKLGKSLRGGEQHIQKVILNLTDQDEKAFSLSFHVIYNTSEDKEPTPTQSETRRIRIGSEDKFKTIQNPYSVYAKGLEVDDDAMFFGRKELVNEIKNSIQNAGDHSKCVLVYGQYRSGKSSLRLYLKKRFMEDYSEAPLLVVDLGNIDAIEDSASTNPFLYQLFDHIIKSLNKTIEDKVEKSNFSSLSYEFHQESHSEESVKDTITQEKFISIISDLKKALHKEWGIQQVVLLMDEFQEIYDKILDEKLDPGFMKTWKGFLQKNLFSAVLVGQQVMAKFRDRFSNEFAAMQHKEVTYLTKNEAEQLITKPILVDGQSRYRERSIERILELTACSPYYIQIICDRLVNHMNNVVFASWVTEADVEEVTTNLIEEYDRADFHNLLASGDKSEYAISEDDALIVLSAIAKGSNKITNLCPKNEINCTRTPSVSVDVILDDLIDRKVIELDKGCYRIKVDLFKKWLIFRG